ncbi:MAG: glycosyltransferase, partial [Salibacteraceae bacterium]
FEVYGISSATFHFEAHGADPDWQRCSVVKTHELPDDLPKSLLSRKIIYLIRDGRDAVVSLAHHRKDIIDASSEFETNLKEAIYAAEESHFGGWSNHVEAWLPHAHLVIYFDDLINHPIECCEKLRSLMDLPKPDVVRLPSFESLKKGQPEYGSGKYINTPNLAEKWFRKGASGAWKDEMPPKFQDLFWHLHGETMEHCGYALNQTSVALKNPEHKGKLLIEGNKLNDLKMDGIKRYLMGLILAAKRFPIGEQTVDVLISGRIYSISEAIELASTSALPVSKNVFQEVKSLLKKTLPERTYNTLARAFPMAKRNAFLFPFRLKHKEKTTLRSLNYDAVLLPLPQHYQSIKQVSFNRLVAVIHDLTHRTHADSHESNNVRLAESGLHWALAHKADLISVSKATQSALAQQNIASSKVYEGVDRRRFHPIPNAHLLDLVRARYALPNTSFILSVSTLEPRKNIPRLIEAYSRLPVDLRHKYHLVLAGTKGWKWKELELTVQCKQHIHFTGYVREDHLPALYTLAYGFAYVSLEEGFGLPVLEAMACGTPVLVSDNSSLPELAGDVGFFCNPLEVDSICDGLRAMMTDNTYEIRIEKGMKRSWQFTWRRAWIETVNVLFPS